MPIYSEYCCAGQVRNVKVLCEAGKNYTDATYYMDAYYMCTVTQFMNNV